MIDSFKDLDAIHMPTQATLKKYGLLPHEWWNLFWLKDGCCHLCGTKFQPGKRINTDHDHVRGWKHMPPEERKKHVRGLLCYVCNRFMLMKGVSSERLWKGWQYMRAWEVRITPESLALQQQGKALAHKPDNPAQRKTAKRSRRRP